ncbi:Cysteine-rich receptor-like protein kinase 2 [Acorus calamus]|uniref:Cysteine-rich receptor-like protein kinase 2 n=1 Tax=Acorus calamus TaxID=4465 RepID=A0AAV9DNU3_ACOCL|nr:Cysteine-rich receptor-like protein kinase 2 [Acorus calamus]
MEQRCWNRTFHNARMTAIYFTDNMENIYKKVQFNRFGISTTGSGPDKMYGLAQCYNYLSQVECALCFSRLRTIAPFCFPNISGRVYLDGCFLRVEDYVFYKEALGPTDHAICGNTTRYGRAFVASAGKVVAVAVSKAEANGGYGEGRESSSAYAMASCLRTLDAVNGARRTAKRRRWRTDHGKRCKADGANDVGYRATKQLSEGAFKVLVL